MPIIEKAEITTDVEIPQIDMTLFWHEDAVAALKPNAVKPSAFIICLSSISVRLMLQLYNIIHGLSILLDMNISHILYLF